MAVQPFQLQGNINQLAGGLFAITHRAKVCVLLQRLFQRNRVRRIVRNHLGDTVNLTIRQLQHAAHITHDGTRFQLSECNNLRYTIIAVAAAHILYHLAPTILTEVHVKVRHGDTFRVQEPFEQQVKAQRIKVGNLQRPRNNRTGTGAPPRTHRNIVILGPNDEIRNDQEVTGKTHLDDGIQLELQTVIIGLRCLCSFAI